MVLEIASAQLSLGAQGDDVARVHRALQTLGRNVPASEIASHVLGPGTIAIVKVLQQELNIPVTGTIDATTVRMINVLLGKIRTDARIVRGAVRDATGNPFSGGFVQVFGEGPTGEVVLGKSPLAADGTYKISYTLAQAAPSRIDVRVAVLSNSGLIDTVPSGLSILANAGPLETLNFTLNAEPSAEFDFMMNDLKPLLGTRNLADLVEDSTRRDVSLLASQSGYSSDRIAALVLAHKLARQSQTPAQVFYGMIRQGLPTNAAALFAMPSAQRITAIKAAADQGVVPKEVGGKKIEEFLQDFVPPPADDFKGILGNLLNSDERPMFVSQFLKSSQDPDAFWKQVATDPRWSNRAAALKYRVQLGSLTNNHAPLVNAVLAIPEMKQASDLARMTEAQWRSLIQAQNVGIPNETPGENAEQKTTNYVRQILSQVETAFPTQFVAERIPASPVATFLKAQTDFDIKRSYPELYLKQNPAAAQPLKQEDRDQLKSIQRIYRITSKATELNALLSKGFHSAQKIASVSREKFAEQNKDALTTERADEIYNNAQTIHATALALFSENASDMNRTGMQALPRVDTARQASLAATSIPDWQTLFGTFDLCSCKECASVHGPSAYLVDVLQFLVERNASAPLFARRPDLGEIELSCENTNTPLPVVDLVNEILENAVAPPPAFSPITLAAALEADLAQTTATPALAAAFNPPLQASARIENLVIGKRWRVWDESFAYTVVKQGTALKVTTRSRQTTGSAAERRAIPQYRNSAAYAELAKSVHPWNLPFDLPSDEAEVFLTHLGVSRRDLIAALRPVTDPFDPNAAVNVRLAAEGLGLSDTERRILVGEALTPPRQPGEFWGFPAATAPVTALSSVQKILDRSELKYAELDEIISTWFVNPTGALTISPKPNEPADTCDTTKLRITGLTVEVITRIQQFARLWKKLGWTISEVDRTLHALAADANTPAINNELLVRLDHLRTLSYLLRLPVASTLALWKPIDTQEPKSLYRSLFYNPTVFKPQDDVFRLRPDGKELAQTNGLLTSQTAALQAVFRLNADGFTRLVGLTDGKLNLTNLSLLFRHATLARALGITIEDLISAKDLTGLDPFRSDRSQDSLRFVYAVRAVRSSSFGFRQLDYLIRHRFNPTAAFVPDDAELGATLTDLRDRLLNIETVTDEDRLVVNRQAVTDRIASDLELSLDATGVLLAKVIHSGKPTLERLLALSSIVQPLSRTTAKAQFETLEKLRKVASVFHELELTDPALAWLLFENSWLTTAPDPPATPVPFKSWYSIIQFEQFRREQSLEDAAVESILQSIRTAAAAANQAARLSAKKLFSDTLAKWLNWPAEDLTALIGKPDSLTDLGLLNARMPDDYRIELVTKLSRAMQLLKRLGTSAVKASEWCETTISEANARAIRGAAKSKYDDETWQKLAGPLQDRLRDRQREALVGYLFNRPSKWTTTTVETADANDLLNHFLIDVEMSPCQLTSRIKQAMSSVQLFAQRSLMGFEPNVKTDDPKWSQWSWMKNFRIWEVNRKIWLYPENWIEPQLRDDKTPFFKDLESELLQTDLTDYAAEQALRRYVEKVDEVSRLEISGVYEDDETHDVHVFGRTVHQPHVYYYRKREGTTKTWTPWSLVEVDIEGDHLIPVVWNRKLMLIWPVFSEKSVQKEVQMPEPGQKISSNDQYYEIQLAWSEYQNSKWSGKYLSDPVTFSAYQGEDNVLFGPFVGIANVVVMLRPRQDNGGGDPFPDPPGGGDDPGGGDPVPPHPNPGPTAKPRRLVSKQLFSFKAFTPGDSLIVRGFLRRDYRKTPVAGDSQIACCIGEFRFAGCRKLVTPAYRKLISNFNFPLAPAGTKFDHMAFTGSGKLTMFDGEFPRPIRPALPDVTIIRGENEPESIAGDPTSTLVNKYDIPVLDAVPTTYQLLAPHQDPQFTGNRPFFLTDITRTFMVTSTGTSGLSAGPDGGNWIKGDLTATWRSSFFGKKSANGDQSGPVIGAGIAALKPFQVLVPGVNGTRTVAELPPVNLTPTFQPRTLLPVFWTTREYTFTNFHHAYLCRFVRTLNKDGISGLLSLETQSLSDIASFDVYKAQARVLVPRPIDEVDFQTGGAYEMYNWELFFHIPLLIADQLSKNQRFEEAQKWFHFIFDPTGPSGDQAPQRYWRTKPFYDRLAPDYEAESVKTIEEVIAKGLSPQWKAAIAIWRSNPFSPHAVARLRTTAYQKTVVMKYIDNLISWGDQLFRRETLESINEATQLYVLAAEILGRQPEVIKRRVDPAVHTFNSLTQVGLLSNSLEQIELLVTDPGEPPDGRVPDEVPDPPSARVLYFCVPENDKLLGYWGTVADRLFKIRHCMNIEGRVVQLPLFEPPIDPALLVRARAAGLSIGEILSDINVGLPNYRFAVMVQKAEEVCSEVKSLGQSLLSVLERRDAEALSTLRSGQELRLLQAVRDVKSKQIDETTSNKKALERSKELAEARKAYYESREFISSGEQSAQDSLSNSLTSMKLAAALRGLAAVLGNLGIIKLGSPTTAGLEIGPHYAAGAMGLTATALDVTANILSVTSQLAGRMAEYGRRQDEWDQQIAITALEIKQIDEQLAGAELRNGIAERELSNHDQQIDDARETDQVLRTRFTNQDLFQWMTGQVSGIYFQSYQLAYDLARRAEMCMQHELGMKYGETSIIHFGYWDSLKKGLLAGDQLSRDLKRLEVAYLDGNVREYELTKHVSLVSLAPEQLIALKETGVCEFEVPEWLFDLDTPGHFRRRLKMVSLTIPCVTGPYTSIHCRLELQKSSYRYDTNLGPGYNRLPADDPSGPDKRFVDDRKITESMVTSHGQNDSGLFDPAMRDERFLPFEGAGAVSRWKLELPGQFKTFDYNTISDVILHLRYTARDGGTPLRDAATAAAAGLLGAADGQPLVRLFSLRHEFPSEWHRFVGTPSAAVNVLTVDLSTNRFPYFVQGRDIKIKVARLIMRSRVTTPFKVAIGPGTATPDVNHDPQGIFTGEEEPGKWTIATSLDPKLIDDVFVIVGYSA